MSKTSVRTADTSSIDQVVVEAPARLHLGFLDLNGGLGRRFGSLGVAIDGLSTRLVATSIPGPDDEISGPEAARIAVMLPDLRRRLPGLPPVRVTLQAVIPAHSGLGSGTQLGLALTCALTRLAGQPLDLLEAARGLERGARSGIGIGAFLSGGVILDGGKGADDDPPPVIGRVDFPTSWRIILLMDGRREGLSGAAERQAFKNLPPFPAETAGDLCRHAVMAFLPGIARADLTLAGPAIGHIQRRVGDHFAPAQGGRFTSPDVAAALAGLEALGIAGVGQSSWGPTGFALVDSPERAEALAGQLRFQWPALEIVIVQGRNEGARIQVGTMPAMRP
ncbi:beta-RFAP synthase [Arboricoccus pini]|uniref:Beta-RFAP synthase n=1 Tax=Arboricoccus pini TaxID=1963835 RepID=A0A212RZZ9_9PROT|nr:GHMP kinase [Arboricoccus pini]SNB78409.1 beta-RFAP synthase [Arboricoccus pini]